MENCKKVNADFFLKMPLSHQESMAISFHKYTHSDWPDDTAIDFKLKHTAYGEDTDINYRIILSELRRFYITRIIKEIQLETM